MESRRAFSLVELLIAVIIFSCLALFSFRSFSSIKNSHERSSFALAAAMESTDVIARFRLGEPYDGIEALPALTGVCRSLDCRWNGTLSDADVSSVKKIGFVFLSPAGCRYEATTMIRVDNGTQTNTM